MQLQHFKEIWTDVWIEMVWRDMGQALASGTSSVKHLVGMDELVKGSVSVHVQLHDFITGGSNGTLLANCASIVVVL